MSGSAEGSEEAAANDAGGAEPELTPQQRAARRRRLAEVFGEVLPEQTGDDLSDPREHSAEREKAGEDWLRRQVPPHHG